MKEPFTKKQYSVKQLLSESTLAHKNFRCNINIVTLFITVVHKPQKEMSYCDPTLFAGSRKYTRDAIAYEGRRAEEGEQEECLASTSSPQSSIKHL